jgi:hypothetical protein
VKLPGTGFSIGLYFPFGGKILQLPFLVLTFLFLTLSYSSPILMTSPSSPNFLEEKTPEIHFSPMDTVPENSSQTSSSSSSPSGSPSSSLSISESKDVTLLASSSPPAFPSDILRIGYILYNEKFMGADTIVWSEEKFFRLKDPPKLFKPFTPISFYSALHSDRPIGRFLVPTFSATFQAVIFEGSSHQAPLVRGIFHPQGIDKVVFNFNPNSFLTNPIRATFSIRFSISIPIDCETIVQFSTHHPRFSADVPFPFVKSAKSPLGDPISLLEPSSNILRLPFFTIFLISSPSQPSLRYWDS